jgi:hypothetical protein
MLHYCLCHRYLHKAKLVSFSNSFNGKYMATKMVLHLIDTLVYGRVAHKHATN